MSSIYGRFDNQNLQARCVHGVLFHFLDDLLVKVSKNKKLCLFMTRFFYSSFSHFAPEIASVQVDLQKLAVNVVFIGLVPLQSHVYPFVPWIRLL